MIHGGHKSRERPTWVDRFTGILFLAYETMASKTTAPQTATSAALGLAAHFAYQVATLQPTNTTTPAANAPSSSLTTSNVAQMDVDDVSDQEWKDRVQQWTSKTQQAPETEGELEDEAAGEEGMSAGPSTGGR